MNLMTEKTKIAKTIRTREFLEEVRTTLLKNYSIGKSTKLTETILKHKVSGSCGLWLQALKAIEDQTLSGTLKRDGSKLKWIYTGNVDGRVDAKLVEALIQKEKEYGKEKRDLAREGTQQIINTLAGTENHSRIPSNKRDSIAAVVKWINGEMEKNTLVPGYLHGGSTIMLPRIKEILESLGELTTVINKLGL